VENSLRSYKAIIDSGAMIAVAKSSLIPEECQAFVDLAEKALRKNGEPC